MKKSFKLSRSIAAAVLAGSCALGAQGAIYTNNFTDDPLSTGEAILTGSAVWVPSGGVNDSGYISLTDAVGSLQGTIILPDFTEGAVIGGFVAEFKVRIDQGSGRPADGMAFVFAPEVNDGTSSFSEEGTGTGLIVSFDSYDNGGVDTAPAIEVKVGGSGDANVVSTVLLGGPRADTRDRGGAIVKDAQGNDLQFATGEQFAPLKIEVRDGVLNVYYKDVHVVKNVVTPFAAVPGRFAFSARTGGEWESHWIDDLRIETFDSTAPTVTEFVGTAGGFRVRLQDPATSALNLDSLNISLNGAPVTPVSNKESGTTTISYVAPTPFTGGTTNEVVLIYTHGTSGQGVTNALAYAVAPYQTLVAGTALPAGQVNTGNPGFAVTVVQARSDAALATDNTTIENLLRGFLIDPYTELPYENYAEPSTAVDPDVINWSQDSGLQTEFGNFQAPAYPDEPIPGIPGLEGSLDNIAAEMITYLELPAGVTRFGVNSDDGFRVTSAPNPRDILATELGTFNGGRGASDTQFDVNVPTAGVYPFRLVWYEGGGSANVEFFTVNLETGEKVLVNDRTKPAAIKAYASATTPLPAYFNRVAPANNATGLMPNEPLEATIVGLTGTSVTVKLNGTELTPTVTTQGTNTIVRAQPTTILPAGSTNTYEVAFGGVTNRVRFGVMNYATLPAGSSVPLTAGDASAAGFRVKVVQGPVTPALENTVARAEAQLAGTLLDATTGEPVPNEAIPGPGPGGVYIDTDVINWGQGAGIEEMGNFQWPDYADELIPGVPGNGGHDDNIAAEIFAYIPLKSGLNRMGVNSDDGFRVTLGTDANTNNPVLGVFDAGRGSADTAFAFVAPEAGLYPIRLVWFEGGGGANVEFFTYNDAGDRVLINDPSKAESPKVFYKVTASVAPKITGITLNGGNIAITWSGTGTLESAEAITGPWATVAGAASGYSTPAAGAARFYRIRQ